MRKLKKSIFRTHLKYIFEVLHTLRQINQHTAVLILSYNNSKLLINLLEDLIKQEGCSIRIYILDNNSRDEHLKSLKGYLASLNVEVTLHCSVVNLGFGRGVNKLFAMYREDILKCRFCALVNQDCILNNVNMSGLIETLIIEKLSLVSPVFNDLNNEVDQEFERISNVVKQYNHYSLVDFTPAAFWILSTKTFEEFDGFDERFFMYGEDKNFCDRLIAKGNIIAVSNEHTVIHPFKRGYKKEIEKGYILSLLLHPTYSLIYKLKVISLRIVRGLFSKRFIDYIEFFLSVFYIFLKSVYSYNASSKVIR